MKAKAIPSRVVRNGKTYRWYNTYFSKKQANDRAKAMRNEGHYAVVVSLGKSDWGSKRYGVYWRVGIK